MFRALRTVFLTQRTFILGGGLVVLFVTGWVWPPLYVAAQLGMLLMAMAVVAEFYLLYGRRSGMRATRYTMERWSNGDVNPVTLQLESGYGTDMHVRVLDELPEQFQKRDLVFSGSIGAWHVAISTTKCGP